MIIPFLSGFIHPFRVPVTLLLILINVCVFQLTYLRFISADRSIDEILEDREFLHRQGSAFAFMIRREKQNFSPTLQQMAVRVSEVQPGAAEILGALALRNPLFVSRAETYKFGGAPVVASQGADRAVAGQVTGQVTDQVTDRFASQGTDQVAIEAWRSRFLELRSLMSKHPSYQLGLTHSQSHWTRWLSYQFTHSGWAHLLWNMLFLFIFGSFIELGLGARVVVLSYIGGGLAGAWFFSVFSGFSASPLVGASGAVSALMAVVGITWWRRERLKFLYFLLPMRGYHGLVLLPSWIILFVLLLPDVGGFLSSSREFGSVAYGAHIGGGLFGASVSGLLALVGWGVQTSAQVERS